jgi:nucleoside-diphosphate-sugar epimerase
MSTLVTGGTGFLGRKLVERLLEEGREITVLSRSTASDLQARGVKFINTSLDDSADVESACSGMETIFHVAARVGVWGPYNEFYRTNVLGTRALLAGAKKHGVKRFIHTSTPSVVYNGLDHRGSDESLSLTTDCPSPYPLTKAIAEREVLVANSDELRTVALRPHLIWGVGDPHLVPRVLARAKAERLRIIGHGQNRVDMVHVNNAVDAHLLAEQALKRADGRAAGRAYFITNDEPVALWDWINELLVALGEPPVTVSISLASASAIGLVCETLWRLLRKSGEPPMTRFIAKELATDHWFNLDAAKHDLNYVPRVSMAVGTAELIASYKNTSRNSS